METQNIKQKLQGILQIQEIQKMVHCKVGMVERLELDLWTFNISGILGKSLLIKSDLCQLPMLIHVYGKNSFLHLQPSPQSHDYQKMVCVLSIIIVYYDPHRCSVLDTRHGWQVLVARSLLAWERFWCVLIGQVSSAFSDCLCNH
jgi:hypothetical protein